MGGNLAYKQMTRNQVSIASIIFAHNEEDVIGRTVGGIMKQKNHADRIFVVADHCSDQTSKIAREGGALVFERNEGDSTGKSAAIRWFFDTKWKHIKTSEVSIIFDADSMIGDDFFHEVRTNMWSLSKAYQAFVQPMYEEKNGAGKIAALSEIFDQTVSDQIRNRLNLPVRMRGTGMAIPTKILRDIAPRIFGLTEDIAITILLTNKGIDIRSMPSAVVQDPKPKKWRGAVNQRARWFRGQFQAIFRYPKELVLMISTKPASWSLLASMFLRPKWLILFAYLLIIITVRSSPFFFWIFVTQLFVMFSYYLIGMLSVTEPGHRSELFSNLPKFIWMWLTAIIRSVATRDWLRSRD